MKKGSKIILVPYPAQGHVNPMMQLALALLNRGYEAVMVTPEFIHHRIIRSIDPRAKMHCISIPDGLEKQVRCDFFAIEKAMEDKIPGQLEFVVRKMIEEDGEDVLCMIVDLLASSSIEVARRCRLPVAGFWPAMLPTFYLISAIPDMITTGIISDSGNPQRPGPICFLSKQEPSICSDDLPWLIGNQAARKARFKFWTRTLDRSRNLQWILVNSFQEESYLNDQNSTSLILQVGALNTYNYTKSPIIKNPSFWEEDRSSLQWLDKQKNNSVMYISFGSWVSPIGGANVRSLALSLESMKQPFIWVLGANWRDGLPAGYIERVKNQGKLVSWAPQLEILQHSAVGCYFTHCGWNSTMEAIQCKKPLLCYPVAGDQFLNCAYIVQKWKIGVRINGFGWKDIEDNLRKVMSDKDMGNRLLRLYQRTMGEQANLRANSNLTAFLYHVNNLKNEFDFGLVM